jgi:hypothetical protein
MQFSVQVISQLPTREDHFSQIPAGTRAVLKVTPAITVGGMFGRCVPQGVRECGLIFSSPEASYLELQVPNEVFANSNREDSIGGWDRGPATKVANRSVDEIAAELATNLSEPYRL